MKKNCWFWVFALASMGCRDVGLGMKYQTSEMGVINGRSITCYRLSWGLDAQAIYIGANHDVCTGFDSSTHICFGRGQYAIDYKITADTLVLYTNAKILIPRRFPIPVRLNNLAKGGKLKEVDFDGAIKDVGCWLVYDNDTREMIVKEK